MVKSSAILSSISSTGILPAVFESSIVRLGSKMEDIMLSKMTREISLVTGSLKVREC
jgi:hypothetical protein